MRWYTKSDKYDALYDKHFSPDVSSNAVPLWVREGWTEGSSGNGEGEEACVQVRQHFRLTKAI